MYTPEVWPTEDWNMLEYYRVFVSTFLNFSHLLFAADLTIIMLHMFLI